MQPTIRSALVLLGGVVVAVIVVGLMDSVAGHLYALPAGTDTNNPESLREAVAGLPLWVGLLQPVPAPMSLPASPLTPAQSTG